MEQPSVTIVCAMIQMVGVWALAGLMGLMAHSLRLPYLTQWAVAWAWLAGGLTALQMVFRFPGSAPWFQPLYHFGGLAFLWLLRQGGRRFRGLPPLRPSTPALLLALVYALGLPHLFSGFTSQFVAHAAVFAGGMAVLAAEFCPGRVLREGSTGIQLTCVGLLLISGIFGTHALTLGLLGPLGMPIPAAYAQFTSLYDFLGEVILAFGLIVAATQDASSRIQMLTRLLPVCAWCRKIRDDHGYWTEFEQWVHAQGVSEVTHGICPDCREKAFQERSARRPHLEHAPDPRND